MLDHTIVQMTDSNGRAYGAIGIVPMAHTLQLSITAGTSAFSTNLSLTPDTARQLAAALLAQADALQALPSPKKEVPHAS